MFDQLAGGFRKLSWVLCVVGLLVTFFSVAFADLPRRDGKKKPPLRMQLLVTCGIFAAGLPGASWGIVRAMQEKQKTPWE